MQVTESLNKGLKRALEITVSKEDLNSKLDAKLEQLKGQVRINGFRPGKVPTAHLKKLYGKSAMSEIVQELITAESAAALEERKERPAYQPDIKLSDDDKDVDGILAGTIDLKFDVEYEVIPAFDIPDFKKVKVEKLVAKVADKEIDTAIAELAKSYQDFEPKKKGSKAKNGDKVEINFVGTVNGKNFEGGSGENVPLELGAKQFIPGFEEQIIGAQVGDEITVKVTFPDDYSAKDLAGSDAEFAVIVLEVSKAVESKLDDEFAKKLGLEDMAQLRERITEQLSGELDQASRQKVKRALLDELEKLVDFELPEKLLTQEFDAIFAQVKEEMERAGKSFEDEDTTEEEATKEYQAIAQRRVRLGLLLAEVGEQKEIKVPDEEVNQALIAQVRQYPGQEQQIIEYYKNNPQAVAQIRAPLFEEKVVDYILELATITDKTVSREELLKADDEDETEEGHVHGPDCDHDHD
ncbi:MAG: trigger factor [Hyphomicrobiales bacterium]|nr:MAG: trigger factor [Hyphomicrobiales bacterium]